jgi:O-antigen/teichoic acid export membrane protein
LGQYVNDISKLFCTFAYSAGSMTNSIKRLAGQTAIYGVSTIAGRLLNYLLVPIYTNYFLTHEFGVISDMYAYVAILIVILTHGMETGFFRYSQQDPGKSNTIFSTSIVSVAVLAFTFVFATTVFRFDIAALLKYPENPEYVLWLGIVIGLDALMAIPYARLRAENRPLMFAFIKLTGIGVNILLVIFFIVAAPWMVENSNPATVNLVSRVYSPDIGIGYVFIANLAASSITFLMLVPVILRHRISFSAVIWKRMIVYTLPLMLAGLAGIINETLDKILLKYLLPEETALSQLGIYSAAYKISVLMSLFIQAFRFAAEPFFFAEYKNENAQLLYARVMKVFVVTCLFIFLGIMLYMDIIQHFIGRDFREGLDIVPILLMAHIFLGIYFNLSIWYKLTGQTHFGAWIAVIGALITIIINVWFIPVIGYYASAWAHLICYLIMTFISWIWGQKYYPVPYDIGRIFLFIFTALAIYFLHSLIPDITRVVNWIISAVLLIVFAFAVLATDREARETLKPLLKKLKQR